MECRRRLDSAQRANAIWKKMLREYEALALDPSINEALQAYMAKRKEGPPGSVS
jgi:trimethylamine---corrinoid protein Co-methyltransferase